ncbi:MAG: transketolase family protein [Eubacteriales bacterium]|nr:transketolase family protein [Eubacteriales bacterium]
MADKIATRQAYGEALAAIGAENNNIVVLDADLSGSTMTKLFAKDNPDRFFNVGIAEQNLYGVSAGLAASGKTVFASTFAMFAAGRAFEIIRNSIGYPHLNVKICATHAGVTVGEDGGSHQCIEDLTLMRSIPGMIVLSPSDATSTKALIKQAADIDGPVYVRLGRAAVPVLYGEQDEIKIGKAKLLRNGKSLTLIATGVMVAEALAAAETLAAEGIDARVLDMHTIKPIDEEAIITAAKETGAIITCEEHTVLGGLGGAVAEVIVQKCPVPMAFVGIKDRFGQSGKPAELLKEYGLTAADIAEAARQMVAQKR